MNDLVLITIALYVLGCSDVYSQQCDGKLSADKSDKFTTGFTCVDGKCRKTFTSCSKEAESLTSLEVCKLTCDLSLWPWPNGDVDVSKTLIPIRFENNNSIKFNSNVPTGNAANKPNKMMKLIKGLKENIVHHMSRNKASASSGIGRKLTITFTFSDSSISFTEKTDESYSIDIAKQNSEITVDITGKTFFGVRHGCETLLQLIVYDTKTNSHLIPTSVSIKDKPAFGYRGLLLDTSRRYYSVESIKKILDGMALNKMNTFHWHMTDTHSFPYISKRYPEMAAIGAYSDQQVYTGNDIKEIVEYARSCGIRVLPELDVPSHVGEGWQHFADPKTGESYLTCFKAAPWLTYCVEPPCGQLNPTVDGVYKVLGDLYEEYFDLFDSDLFHMGCDEVSLTCWNTTQIKHWVKKSPIAADGAETDLHFLWYYFQQKATEELEKANGGSQRIILWTSSLTKHANFSSRISPEKHIVQIWENKSSHHITGLLRMGYDVIFSVYDELYLDCGFGNWITDGHNWCSPYVQWQKLYMSNPYVIVEQLGLTVNDQIRKQILGSEAPLWSEQADGATADGRIWPRVAALAERLWTNPKTGWQEAKSRLSYQRERLVSLGTDADVLEPLWCVQNDGLCLGNA